MSCDTLGTTQTSFTGKGGLLLNLSQNICWGFDSPHLPLMDFVTLMVAIQKIELKWINSKLEPLLFLQKDRVPLQTFLSTNDLETLSLTSCLPTSGSDLLAIPKWNALVRCCSAVHPSAHMSTTSTLNPLLYGPNCVGESYWVIPPKKLLIVLLLWKSNRLYITFELLVSYLETILFYSIVFYSYLFNSISSITAFITFTFTLFYII